MADGAAGEGGGGVRLKEIASRTQGWHGQATASMASFVPHALILTVSLKVARLPSGSQQLIRCVCACACRWRLVVGPRPTDPCLCCLGVVWSCGHPAGAVSPPPIPGPPGAYGRMSLEHEHCAALKPLMHRTPHTMGGHDPGPHGWLQSVVFEAPRTSYIPHPTSLGSWEHTYGCSHAEIWLAGTDVLMQR
jgi:hypothetical protein